MKCSRGIFIAYGAAAIGFVVFCMAAGVRAEEKFVPDSVKVPIFVYHHVRPHVPTESPLQDEYDITPELFEEQLVYLRDHGYTAVTLDDLVSLIGKKTTAPVLKPVILTFDDGWENQYVYAFPLLKKYHTAATFYVYTNPIGKAPYLTWGQIKEMDAAGMTIASHTLLHPHMNRLSAAERKREIVESKQVLEEKLGKPVLHFALPFGYASPAIIAIVREAGYATCRTTDDGVYHTSNDLLKLRATVITDDFRDFVDALNR